MVQVHHRTATVQGHRVFYREAGPAGAPVVLLLHGFPTSSRMFRHLIPALADRYHVIAPDHIGFGQSATPPPTEFTYTFDALADVTQVLLDQLGVDRFSMYVQDYGAPIGWRLALRRPAAVQAIITPERQRLRRRLRRIVLGGAVGLRAVAHAGQGGTGTRRARSRRHPMAVPHRRRGAGPRRSRHMGTRPHRGQPARQRQIQLALFRDYATNPPLYPAVHAVLPGQPGPAAGDLGQRRRDLRPGRSRGVRPRPARRRDPSPRWRSLPARKPPSTPLSATSGDSSAAPSAQHVPMPPEPPT